MAVGAREDFGTELLVAARGGDADALQELFDLHGAQVWTFALRVCCEPAAAREVARAAFAEAEPGQWPDAACALLAAASRAASRLAAPPRPPEPATGLGSLQERVRECNARLPARQREALALRALAGLSYDAIAAIMDLNRAGVAQLVARARLALAQELRRRPGLLEAMAEPECARAVPLVAMRLDGQLRDVAERDWLDAHLMTCESCALTRRAMHEADLSYRAWLPTEAPAGLRAAVTGFEVALPGRRFARSVAMAKPAAARRQARRIRRRVTALALLCVFAAGVTAVAVGLFKTNRVAPDPAGAAATERPSALPTPQAYEPAPTDSSPVDPPEPTRSDLRKLERQRRQAERRAVIYERRYKATVRRQQAARERRAEARERAQAKRRRESASKPKPKRRRSGGSGGGVIVGEVPDPDANPSGSPEPTGTGIDEGG